MHEDRFARALTICLFLGVPSTVKSAEPLKGKTMPVHCRVTVNGKTALDLTNPAPRPYPLAVHSRKLSVGLGFKDGILSVRILDTARSVSHGSWSSAYALAQAEAKLGGSGSLKLMSGDAGGPEPVVEVDCALLSASAAE
jgi:hypothetical protein